MLNKIIGPGQLPNGKWAVYYMGNFWEVYEVTNTNLVNLNDKSFAVRIG